MYYARQSRWKYGAIVLLPLALLVIALLIVACGAAATATSDPFPADEGAEQVVIFSHTYFDPSRLTIVAGETVIFQNLATMSHPLLSPEAGFETGAFTQGHRSFTFYRPGTFTITNIAHGTEMTIVVE